jgi:hypothetical protein
MESEGYDVRRKRTSNLFEGLCVKHQEERAITPAVEDHRDDHASQTICTTGANGRQWIATKWRVDAIPLGNAPRGQFGSPAAPRCAQVL